MKFMNPFLLLLSTMLVSAACNKHGQNVPGYGENYDNTTILKWNEATAIAVRRTGDAPPMTESRVFAMVNVAMHDAINNIVKKYHTYAFSSAADKTADPYSAAAQAAHEVLVNLLPGQQAFADSVLEVSLTSIVAGIAKEKGITLGKSAAAAILTKRRNDGASTAQYPIVQGSMPGQYQSTLPFSATGFALFPGWGKVEPFSLRTSNQFRPGAPYATNTSQYTADFNEVKTMGAATGSNRTTDQTQLGIFWLENVPASWNRVTRTLIAQKNLDGYQTAHLLALLNMAEADANIAVFEGKYFYNYWRPVTAVRFGRH